MNGWSVLGATLAAGDALEAALAALPGRAPMVFPFFMSDGWFVRRKLPQRLRACGWQPSAILRPLGLQPALQELCLDYARGAASLAGFVCQRTMLLLAAHGSPSDPRSRIAAETAASVIAASGAFRGVRLGFIDEAPFLAEAAMLDAPALCLPFFAARAGHVTVDLPDALADCAFPGPLLEPIGGHPGVAGIVQAALLAEAAERTARPKVSGSTVDSAQWAMP